MGRSWKHLPGDILAISRTPAIVGAESYLAAAAFGRVKRDWLSGLLRLPDGIPRADSFQRVCTKLLTGR